MKKIFVFLLSLCPFLAYADVKLPRLISDGMILQREQNVKVWGWADPYESIHINFNTQQLKVNANANGEWMATFKPMSAGGPYSMVIKGKNTLEVKDILLGDVWVCSGQSNMETPMRRLSWIYPTEIANSENDRIRQFYVPRKFDFNEGQKDFLDGSWKKANPTDILNFSGVAYFFAKEINARYNVAVGIINTSYGGSPAEAWINEEAIKNFPAYYNELLKCKDTAYIKNIERTDNKISNEWYSRLYTNDLGKKTVQWSEPTIDFSQWPIMNIPGYWDQTILGETNGVVWFKRTVNVPASLAGQKANLILGRIVDADSVYVNGKFVGTISYQYPPRRYPVPEGLLQSGLNEITVRIISNSGKGGFVPDKDYEIQFDNDTLDLTGSWHYRLGAKMEPLRGRSFFSNKPTGLYNAMIHPLLNFSVKGVLWYQGESNADRYSDYSELVTTLINNWREKWQRPNLPFIYVQLPNFMEACDIPCESNWAYLREEQSKILKVENTAMVVAIDLGEWNDIHPLNKKDVGFRLSLAARNLVYGEKQLVAAGPLYKNMKTESEKIVLTFTNIGSGLVAKNGKELKRFAIAGADKKFVWARAEINGNTVIVWNDSVKNPVAVRYAWENNPAGANLYNKEGFPAAPFRTDEWKKE